MDQAFQIVNFVKGRALNSLLFMQLCTGMDAAHLSLLFLHKCSLAVNRNVTERVFELRDELNCL